MSDVASSRGKGSLTSASPSASPADIASLRCGASLGVSSLQGLIEDLVSGLLPAVRSGEASAIEMSRRLFSAMLLAGPEGACDILVRGQEIVSVKITFHNNKKNIG